MACYNPHAIRMVMRAGNFVTPGGDVTGELQVDVLQRLTCNRVVLKVSGIERVVVQTLTREYFSGGYTDTTNKDEYEEIHYEKEYVLCKPNVVDPTGVNAPSLQLEPGSFVVPFTVTIPAESPPSYHIPFVLPNKDMMGEANLEYHLKAAVETTYGVDAEQELMVVVAPAIPRCLYDSCRMEPIVLQEHTPLPLETKDTSGCCFWGKNSRSDTSILLTNVMLLQSVVALPVNGHFNVAVPAVPPPLPPCGTYTPQLVVSPPPGQFPSTSREFQVRLKMQNRSEKPLDWVRLDLIQKVVAMNLTMEQRLASQVFSIQPPIKPGQEAHTDVLIPVCGSFASEKYVHGKASPMPTLRTPMMETTTFFEISFPNFSSQASVYLPAKVVLTSAIDGQNIVPGDLRFKA